MISLLALMCKQRFLFFEGGIATDWVVIIFEWSLLLVDKKLAHSH